MARPYFILAVREGDHITDASWGIAFGAYDRADVASERDDYRYNGWKARELKILRCEDARQATCNAAIAALNAAEG